MKATFPIIICDHEDGCEAWTLDWYTANVTDWRDLMAEGWQYDPDHPDRPHLCSRHNELMHRLNHLYGGLPEQSA